MNGIVPGRRGLLVAALMIGVAASPPPAPPDPGTYRTDRYDSPTPLTLNGAPALTTDQAARLWRSKRAIFVS